MSGVLPSTVNTARNDDDGDAAALVPDSFLERLRSFDKNRNDEFEDHEFTEMKKVLSREEFDMALNATSQASCWFGRLCCACNGQKRKCTAPHKYNKKSCPRDSHN